MWAFLWVAPVVVLLFAWPVVREQRAAVVLARRREQWDRDAAEALAVAAEPHRWECPRPGCGDSGSAPTVAEARRELYRHVDGLCVFYRRARDRSAA